MYSSEHHTVQYKPKPNLINKAVAMRPIKFQMKQNGLTFQGLNIHILYLRSQC